MIRDIPVTPRSNGEWPSSVGHLLWEQEVGGSNPPSPTNQRGAPPSLSGTGPLLRLLG